jgi:HAD superfamily hydrolase (TIGR01509 family)
MLAQNLPAAVLWDLDGTLIDSEHYWMLSEQALASRYPGEWKHEDGLDLIGLALPVSCQIMKERMGIHDLSIDEIMHELTDGVLANLEREIPWRPGALELLQALNAAGVKQALVTMSMRRMALTVANSFESEIFQIVVAGDDVTNGKPHPEAYLMAAAALGVNPEYCVAFEDSMNGLRSAEAAGTRAVAVPNMMHIPEQEGRVIWSTLENVELQHLIDLFAAELPIGKSSATA